MKETISTFLILLASWLGVYNPQPLGDFDALPGLVSTSTPFSAYTTRSGKSLYLPSRTVTSNLVYVLDTTGCTGANALATDSTGKIICATDDNSGGAGGDVSSATGVSTWVAVFDGLHSVTSYNWYTAVDSTKQIDVNGGIDAFSVTSVTASSSKNYIGVGVCSGTSAIGTDATGKLICATGYEVTLTAGDGLTRTANDIDCDVASASIPGCLDSADFINFNISNTSTLTNYINASSTLPKIINGGLSVVPKLSGSVLVAATTSDLAQGTNLYYTDAQVDANINASTTIAMGDPVDDTAFIGNGSAWQIKAVPNCVDSGGQHLNYTAASNAFSCGTTGDGAGGGSSNWSFFNLLTISPTSTVGITIQTVATTTNLTVTSISGIVKCNGEAQCAAGVADTDYQQAITFTANDFDYSAPTLSIDYANGQAASASADGFLQSADFINFNISTTSTLNATSTLLKAAWLDDNILIGSGSAWELKSIPNCTDASGNHLNYTAASNSFSCGTTASYGDTNVATYINASTTMPIIPAGGLTGVTLLSGGRALSATTVLDVVHGGTGAGLFTAGSIVFAGTSGVYTQDNANFYWDDTNNRFGIASSVPAFALSVNDATQGAFWVDTKATGNVFEVQNATSNILFSVATSTGNMTFHGHITASAVPLLTAPVVSACGTGTPTVVGNDSAGAVTVGGGVQASCVLTFQKSWTIAPSCFANDSSALQAVKASATVSALTLSVATTFAGEVVNYFCIGY